MNNIHAFLNPIQVENKGVIISKRFQENGKPIPFVIRPITQEENTLLIRKHTKRNKKGTEVFNQTAFIQDLTASAVVYPDLKNAEIQKAYGVLGEADLLSKMLLVGEYAELASEVQKLSGLEVDINDEIEEAKN